MNNDSKKFMEDETIYLRDVNIDDVNEDYYGWLNDPDVTKYTESRFYPQTIADIKEYVAQEAKSADSVFFAIISKEDNKHIGNIKLHRINWIHRHAELSILIGDKSFWGKGIGQRAIRLATEYAFAILNLYKVYAECYSVNKASIKAFQKAGYEEEGLLKNHYYFSNQYIDGIRLCALKH